jgi:type VI secretion system secreted protein Hcp
MSHDMFIKIDDNAGEAVAKGLTGDGWIEISSFTFGVQQVGVHGSGGAGGTGGKANFSDLSFTKVVDKSSPLLMLSCARGSHINTATLVVRKSTGGDTTEVYYTIAMTDVLVSSWSNAVAADQHDVATVTPQEAVSLNFNKITFTYKPQDSKTHKLGADILTGYDIKLQTKA